MCSLVPSKKNSSARPTNPIFQQRNRSGNSSAPNGKLRGSQSLQIDRSTMATKSGFISFLPKELCHMVLSYLSNEDLLICFRVSQAWKTHFMAYCVSVRLPQLDISTRNTIKAKHCCEADLVRAFYLQVHFVYLQNATQTDSALIFLFAASTNDSLVVLSRRSKPDNHSPGPVCLVGDPAYFALDLRTGNVRWRTNFRDNGLAGEIKVQGTGRTYVQQDGAAICTTKSESIELQNVPRDVAEQYGMVYLATDRLGGRFPEFQNVLTGLITWGRKPVCPDGSVRILLPSEALHFSKRSFAVVRGPTAPNAPVAGLEIFLYDLKTSETVVRTIIPMKRPEWLAAICKLDNFTMESVQCHENTDMESIRIQYSLFPSVYQHINPQVQLLSPLTPAVWSADVVLSTGTNRNPQINFIPVSLELYPPVLGPETPAVDARVHFYNQLLEPWRRVLILCCQYELPVQSDYEAPIRTFQRTVQQYAPLQALTKVEAREYGTEWPVLKLGVVSEYQWEEHEELLSRFLGQGPGTMASLKASLYELTRDFIVFRNRIWRF
ncbi:hypothetical protein BJ508DRAFT_315510 [Ascobolus immersus RN42]|uniref:F-box domain-containing protein n=1 Tax=Ascobolus immersus RN42 TaxID=1160509 RepID=A0A3N4HAG9_ASCIM|nr:hypothetical protein BJ508DRAFT_315510 [Ascobolus immersus RN42]